LKNYFFKTYENIEKKANELNKKIADLYDQTSVIKSNLLDIAPKSYEAADVYAQLEVRTSTVQRMAEEMTTGTQNLLDDANNAMDDLNAINKSIAGNTPHVIQCCNWRSILNKKLFICNRVLTRKHKQR